MWVDVCPSLRIELHFFLLSLVSSDRWLLLSLIFVGAYRFWGCLLSSTNWLQKRLFSISLFVNLVRLDVHYFDGCIRFAKLISHSCKVGLIKCYASAWRPTTPYYVWLHIWIFSCQWWGLLLFTLLTFGCIGYALTNMITYSAFMLNPVWWLRLFHTMLLCTYVCHRCSTNPLFRTTNCIDGKILINVTG